MFGTSLFSLSQKKICILRYRKEYYQEELFSNRLKRKYKELRKQMRKNRVSCYRLYDRDIPEVPVSLDLYEFLPDGVDSVLEAARFMSAQNERLSANDPAVDKEIKDAQKEEKHHYKSKIIEENNVPLKKFKFHL